MAEAIELNEGVRADYRQGVARQARGRRRRREILEATLRVIARNGVAGVTHRAVAAEAGVPLASTTYYFASKGDLLAEAFRHHRDQQVERVTSAKQMLLGREPSLDEAVDTLVAHVIENLFARRDDLVAEIELQVEAIRREELRELCRSWDQMVTTGIAQEFERLGSAHPLRDAHLLLMAVSGVQIDALSRGAEQASAETLRPLFAHLVRALLAAESLPVSEPQRAAVN